MDYQKTGLQQFSQPQCEPQSAYDAHQRAVSEWFEVCKAFQEISARRATAEKQLEAAIQVLSQHIDQTRSDPTQPSQTPAQPGNAGIPGYYGPR